MVINRIVANKVEVILQATQISEKNERFICHLKVKNEQRFPLAPIHCRLKCENLLTGEARESVISFPLGGKEKDVIPFYLESQYCGSIRISIMYFKIYDVFGLWAVNVNCEEKAETIVLPLTFPLSLSVSTHMRKDVEAHEYSQNKAGSDPSETFAIREYHPGDNLHRIHWKLSAKFDELLIKEPGLPIQHSLLVLLETNFLGNLELQPDIKDTLIEIMLSTCQKMTEEQISYEVAWRDHENDRFFHSHVQNIEDLTGVTNKLLSARYQNNEINTLTSLTEINERSHFEHILYISSFLPEDISRFSTEILLTGIICTQNAEAISDKTNNLNLYYCSPANYETELSVLSI